MNIKAIFSIIFCFVNVGVFGQRQFTGGTLTYTISIQTAKSETPISNPLNGAVLTQYTSLNQSRSDMKSSLGMESTVYNNKSGKGFILKEYSGQKLMITMNSDNWIQKNQFYGNLIFKIDNDNINIGEYKCKKATAVTENGKNFTVYFTPDIILANTRYNNAFGQLPGLPVQYELQSGNLNFVYTLNNISYDPVPSSKFEIPKSGYRVMTYEENQQLKKGE